MHCCSAYGAQEFAAQPPSSLQNTLYQTNSVGNTVLAPVGLRVHTSTIVVPRCWEWTLRIGSLIQPSQLVIGSAIINAKPLGAIRSNTRHVAKEETVQTLHREVRGKHLLSNLAANLLLCTLRQKYSESGFHTY